MGGCIPWEVQEKAHVAMQQVGVHERDKTATATILSIQCVDTLQESGWVLLPLATQHLKYCLVQHSTIRVLREGGGDKRDSTKQANF